jgi:EAL domain-containing protein (putative c-di-GMP-specific phosphodiesterase class I)
MPASRGGRDWPREGLARSVQLAGKRALATRKLIADGRFRLVFQPVVRLSDRRVHHYEALLRPVSLPDTPHANTQCLSANILSPSNHL